MKGEIIINKTIMMGRLTKDPEIRYTSGQTSTCVANIDVAVNRRFKREGQPDADFFRCSAFGKTAEFIEKYLKKGTKVVFSGSLQNNNYTDKNGVQHYAVVIILDEIEFAESKGSGSAPADIAKTDADGFMQIPDGSELDELLPFT